MGGTIATTNGADPPQLRQIAIAINRHGRFTPKGLPICHLKEIQPSTTADALKSCRSSLIGEGHFSAKILLPQQAPFPSEGKVFAFNGVMHGVPAVLAHVYGTKPAPTSFTLPFAISSAKGTFGTVLTASLPQVTSDWGYVTGLQIDPRSHLHLPRPEAQLPQRRLPRPRGLSRCGLSLRPGQLCLRGQEHPHLDPDPQLRGAEVDLAARAVF